jgi:hypothetical protein
MVTFNDSDGVVSLYRDGFDLDTRHTCVLSELLARKLLSGVRNELTGRAQVGMDPTLSKDVPGVGCADILKPLVGWVSCAFVDYVKYRLSSDINVDDYRVIEINVQSLQ